MEYTQISLYLEKVILVIEIRMNQFKKKSILRIQLNMNHLVY